MAELRDLCGFEVSARLIMLVCLVSWVKLIVASYLIEFAYVVN
jgi:hypothetical protein